MSASLPPPHTRLHNQVDVTTDEKNPDGSNINLADKGVRAVIGGKDKEWLTCGCLGIAFVGAFGVRARAGLHGCAGGPACELPC